MKAQTELQIKRLQDKVKMLQPVLEDEIYEICEGMDYKNSSNFSYNIDRLRHFIEQLVDFKEI